MHSDLLNASNPGAGKAVRPSRDSGDTPPGDIPARGGLPDEYVHEVPPRVAQAVGNDGLQIARQVATDRIAHGFRRPEFAQPLLAVSPNSLEFRSFRATSGFSSSHSAGQVETRYGLGYNKRRRGFMAPRARADEH